MGLSYPSKEQRCLFKSSEMSSVGKIQNSQLAELGGD